MAEVTLAAARREANGKKGTRKLRRDGKIPAVYYIKDGDSIALSVESNAFFAAFSGSAKVIDLDFGKKEVLPTIVREVQFDPVTSAPVHVDFLGVHLDKKVIQEVPLSLVGTPKGAKEGGVQQLLRRSVVIECLPLDLPESIEVEVAELDINDSLTVGDVKFDKGEIVTDGNAVILSVLPPKIRDQK